MKKLIQFIFRTLGFEIRRYQPGSMHVHHYNDQMKQGLERFANLNQPVNTVLDVGAAQGYWSLSAKAFWPHASYVLFEPLEERRVELQTLVKTNEKFHYVSAAAGKEKGTTHFSVTTDLDGSGIADSYNAQTRTIQVTSIQDEVSRLGLQGPYLIKLDTHGFEVPIIEGCEAIMPEVSVFIIESYGLKIANNSLLFWDMCAYMEKLGFRLFDLVDVMHRPKDNAFWQCDAFFIRKEHALFKDNTYW